MHLPIPLVVLYAGLAGTLLALGVAAATNGWSLRVFCLLALRLAIGWHFLFEGLHKIHSHAVGVTDTNKPFTSEFYFAAAEGPFGEQMRRDYLGDPAAKNAARLTPKRAVGAAEFAQMPPHARAELCPDAAAAEITAGLTDPVLGNVEAAKALFAAWVHGATTRDSKVKFVTGDVPLTAPERLAHIERLRRDVAAVRARDREHLGGGYGIEVKTAAGARTDLQTAQADLAKDTDALIAELNTLAGKEAGKAEKPTLERKIETIDLLTRWGITAIGAGLLLGLFTRVWCVAGAGFLILTYLSHPTVPWLPLPPMTEGNPLYVNKNLVEALGLLALATFPSGRWLGLDALLPRFGRRRPATV